MRKSFVTGVSMSRFGKYLDRSYKDLAGEVVRGALEDAGLLRDQIGAVWFANSGWGRREGQDCIRGQVALRSAGIERIPIMNVENACAGGSSALHGAWLAVSSGSQECALAVGVEKTFHPDKLRLFAGFLGGLDVGELHSMLDDWEEAEAEIGISAAFIDDRPLGKKTSTRPRRGVSERAQLAWQYAQDIVVLGNLYGWNTLYALAKRMQGRADRSPFMDAYSLAARHHMKRYGSTIEQLAIIAAKNHHHGALNPRAQYQIEMTEAEVLADRRVSYPLTRAMCAPIGDGAAAVVVCSEAFVRKLPAARPVAIRASVLGSGSSRRVGDPDDIGIRVARVAYEQSGVGPEDVDLAELHDATAFGELHHCETLGFCAEGEGGPYAASGATRIGGSRPINTSGGMECRGHPIAATGLAQIVELTEQLRSEAGARQVANARIALAQNGGGVLGVEEAAMCVHILAAAGC
jgi:acetyl-CoA acetyltransferase